MYSTLTLFVDFVAVNFFVTFVFGFHLFFSFVLVLVNDVLIFAHFRFRWLRKKHRRAVVSHVESTWRGRTYKQRLVPLTWTLLLARGLDVLLCV